MSGIHDNIRARVLYLVSWEVIQIIMTSMNLIVDVIILNQYYGK